MLSSQYRLKRSEDYIRLYREGKTTTCAWMKMCYRRNGRMGTRIGFVVPNTVIKHATGRNRLRRQLRTVVQKNFPFFPVGYDVVFVVKRYSLSLPFSAIEKDFLSLVQHLGPLKKKY
ncbi:MAG: ribonuclease P protein component [Patescibacteria group bacterium]